MSDENAMEALAREIQRVATIREQYAEIDRQNLPGVNFKPAMFMMDASLKAAREAVGSNDPVAVVRALTDLREYDA